MQRYRITFVTGLAVGFVLGARAGCERYEQMKRATRRVADSPAAQQAAGAVQAQAVNLAKATKQQVTDRMPKVAETANKVTSQVTSQVASLRHRNGSLQESGGSDSAAASEDRSLTPE